MARCTKMVKGARGDRRCKNQATAGKTTCALHTAGRRKSRSRSRTVSKKRQAGGRSVVRRQLGGADDTLDALIAKLKESTAKVCNSPKESADDFAQIMVMTQEFEQDLRNVMGQMERLKAEAVSLQTELQQTHETINQAAQFKSEADPAKIKQVFELQMAQMSEKCKMELLQIEQAMKSKMAESEAALVAINDGERQAVDKQKFIENRLRQIDSAINKHGRSTEAAVAQVQTANNLAVADRYGSVPQAPPLLLGGFRFW